MLSLCLLIHYQPDPGVLLQSQHALSRVQNTAHRWELSTLLKNICPISYNLRPDLFLQIRMFTCAQHIYYFWILLPNIYYEKKKSFLCPVQWRNGERRECEREKRSSIKTHTAPSFVPSEKQC